MKVRLDFVTNSSSSSFIIAKHVNFKMEDLEKLLTKSLENFAKEQLEYIEEYDEDDYRLEGCKTKKQKLEKIKNDVLDGFKTLNEDMKLGDWSVSVIEGSSEDEDFLSLFLYNHCEHIDAETIKFSST